MLDHFPTAPHFRRVLKKFFGLFLLMVATGSVPGAEPERSVIQIMTFSQQPVWDAPWRFEPVRRSGGSRFVIKGKSIITNAHLGRWGKEGVVRRHQEPPPHIPRGKIIAAGGGP